MDTEGFHRSAHSVATAAYWKAYIAGLAKPMRKK